MVRILQAPFQRQRDFVGVYDTAKEAAHKIAQCYYIDAHSCQKDEYYYFMKKH